MFLAIQVGEARPVHINTVMTGKPDAPCQATVTNPKGQKVNLLMQQTPEGYQTVFAPMEPGPHKVNVNFAGKEVPKSPFNVNVEPAVDVGAVEVLGLEKRKYHVTYRGSRSDFIMLVDEPDHAHIFAAIPSHHVFAAMPIYGLSF